IALLDGRLADGLRQVALAGAARPKKQCVFAFADEGTRGQVDPSLSQIGGRRFPADARGLLNAPQRPSQPPQRDDLLFLLLVQDVAHIDAGYSPSRLS